MGTSNVNMALFQSSSPPSPEEISPGEPESTIPLKILKSSVASDG
eukprot:CAMPEP_0174340418 /NCGR_PEP_ID=MMETSP0810-20121108/24655_1 /TAXON_ID=73025 ORGANISM="Eutreptiella gymnastica-like, Strain CCMP1594" /NCGR_SAMPLE_ID=MMETSP0810 /ASSEMBLY_ACC=CAM_ASM_000659 /LENGTH=44 /DNA_ID= /DNA_START= /DNA_END= /DNA_ORIENTATION=